MVSNFQIYVERSAPPASVPAVAVIMYSSMSEILVMMLSEMGSVLNVQETVIAIQIVPVTFDVHREALKLKMFQAVSMARHSVLAALISVSTMIV